MSEICNPAMAEGLSAYYVPGFLVIVARGVRRPTPCYKIRIKLSPLDIFPPQYVLVQCVDPAIFCVQVVPPPIDVFAIFPMAVVPGRSITVHTASGPASVPVNVLDAGDAGGFSLAGIPRLFGLDEERIEAGFERVTATGYSFSDPLSFDEAFADAVRNLPPSDIADWQDVIHVEDTGAVIGGFIGERKMFVKIYTYRPN